MTSMRMSRATVQQASLVLIILIGVSSQVAAQASSSSVGFVARYGWSPSGAYGDAYGLGLELEVFPSNALVPSIRIDTWDFGINCVGFGPCPSSVTTVSLGAKYRFGNVTAMVPYAGGDVGYMKWASDATGVSLRARTGVDIRVVRHLGFNVDASYTQFVVRSTSQGGMLQKDIWGFSAGLRLWL